MTSLILARAADESDSAMIACSHATAQKFGKDRQGNQRYKCSLCGKRFTEQRVRPLGSMYTDTVTAKLALRLLVEGNCVRGTARITGLDKATILKLIVRFGGACQRFLDRRMQGLTLTHLQFDEQHTYVAKKQARLTTDEKAERSDVGEIYLWTCIDQQTKLMPSFWIGKRSADNARRFMRDVAGRLVFPNPHASDARDFLAGGYRPTLQVSTDGFAAYPEAVDFAFGPYVKFGTIIKEYRNARIVYTPSEMVGTKRKGIKGIDRAGAAHDMHLARRTLERHPAAFPQAAQPVDLLLQQESREPRGRVCHVRGVLQLLLANPGARNQREAAADGGHDGQDRRPRLELRRAFCGGVIRLSARRLEWCGYSVADYRLARGNAVFDNHPARAFVSINDDE